MLNGKVHLHNVSTYVGQRTTIDSPLADSSDQDQTEQNIQSDFGFTFSVKEICFGKGRKCGKRKKCW